MKKKIFIIGLLFLTPLLVSAEEGGGLLPCGPGTAKENCDLCDIFVLIDRILKFVMGTLIPPIATVMFLIGGIWFYFSGASEENKRRARAIITSAVIGIVVILAAWIIVNAILVESGIVNSDSIMPWYDIECSVSVEE